MRGDGDMPMTTNGESNIALLETIVADQRKIIAEVTKKDPSKTPQLWALYKEVQDYYDKGMRVPDDVTLLFSDDNWGNMRRLPSAADRNRPGGFGIYYHFDYVGGPRNYKWINTNPIARVWEQMHLAYEYGANRIWIVNVGDLKPMEFPIQFFLDYAWNPKAIARRATAGVHAAVGGAAVRRGARVGDRRHHDDVSQVRRPAQAGAARHRDVQPRELSRGRARRRGRTTRCSRAREAVGERAAGRSISDAYYELVLHPVQAAANLNDLYVTAAKNRLYALAGPRGDERSRRASARAVRSRRRDLAVLQHGARRRQVGAHDGPDAHRLHVLAGAAAQHDAARRRDPGSATLRTWASRSSSRIGCRSPVAAVRWRRPAAGLRVRRTREVALPTFDPYQRQTYHVDVYNKRTDVVHVLGAGGRAVGERVAGAAARSTRRQRVAVSVDWTRAPAGERKVPITFTGPNNVALGRCRPSSAIPRRRSAIRSSGSSRATATCRWKPSTTRTAVGSANGAISWQTIPDLGKTLSGMTAMPVTARDADARRQRAASRVSGVPVRQRRGEGERATCRRRSTSPARRTGCATPCRSTIRRRRS